MRPPVQEPAPREEPPPFFGSWGRVYAAVLVYLVSLIALFFLFGRLFTP